MVLIKKQYLLVTSDMLKALLVFWDKGWKREVNIWKQEISCLEESVVKSFFGGLWVAEVFLESLKGVLKFLEYTRLKREQSHIMVTFKGSFKVETGNKWHMLPLVYITDSGIEVRRWVGRWIGVWVE